MYFKRLSRSTSWLISGGGLSITASETEAGIEAEGQSFPDLTSAMKFFGPGTTATLIGPPKNADSLIQLDTGDGETYKIKRQADGLKLWGKSIKVTVFPSWEKLFENFDQVFFKKLETFKDPEYVCTDSKGRYVATIKLGDGGWTTEVEGGQPVVHSDLNDAMEGVLLSL